MSEIVIQHAEIGVVEVLGNAAILGAVPKEPTPQELIEKATKRVSDFYKSRGLPVDL